ncbi:MAG: glycosyltransferase family 39 protein, partial [Planctomycetota bacterium]
MAWASARASTAEPGALDRRITRATAWLLTPWSFRLAILGYMALLFAMRGFLFPGAPNDDSEQLLYSQSFDLGYDIRNPPLYTWLVIVAQQLLGVSIAAVSAVKFSLLALIYLLFHETARLVLRDERWAIVAALSPLAIYYIAWDSMRNYSHSVLVVFACLLTLFVLLRLERSGRLGWYLALGATFAVGMVSKYNYLLFALALILTCLADAGFRRRVLDRRIGLSIALTVALLAAPVLWTVDHLSMLPEIAANKFALEPQHSWLKTRALGAASAASSLVETLSPLVLLLPLFFWPAFKPLPPAGSAVAGDVRRYQRFLCHLFLIMVAGLLLTVLLTG